MEGLQYFELIIVAVLFVLQIYFCFKVFMKTRLISKLLPNVDMLDIDRESIIHDIGEETVDEFYNGNKDSISYENSEDIDNTSNNEMSGGVLYFNDMRTEEENGKCIYVFSENGTCIKDNASIELQVDGKTAMLRPCGNYKKMQLMKNRPFFTDVFMTVSGLHNDDDIVLCIDTGKCIRKNGKWQIVKKCLIEF